MVVGGYPYTVGKKSEIYDLSGNNLTCPSVPDFPTAEYGSVGIFINNKALVCGGFAFSVSTFYSECFSYNTEVLKTYNFFLLSSQTNLENQ